MRAGEIDDVLQTWPNTSRSTSSHRASVSAWVRNQS